MGRREQNKRDKRTRIAAAARALFDADGFEATTIRAIATRAGVGTGTVLLYAGSKVDLLFSLFVDELEEVIVERQARLPADAPLVDQLVFLFGGLLERYAEHPDLSRVYVKETLFHVSPQTARYDALTFAFLTSIAELVAGPRDRMAPGVEPATVAAAAFGLYLQQVAQMLRAPRPDPRLATEALRQGLQSLLAPLFPGDAAPEAAPRSTDPR